MLRESSQESRLLRELQKPGTGSSRGAGVGLRSAAVGEIPISPALCLLVVCTNPWQLLRAGTAHAAATRLCHRSASSVRDRQRGIRDTGEKSVLAFLLHPLLVSP